VWRPASRHEQGARRRKCSSLDLERDKVHKYRTIGKAVECIRGVQQARFEQLVHKLTNECIPHDRDVRELLRGSAHKWQGLTLAVAMAGEL
jgi:hypothetical protein